MKRQALLFVFLYVIIFTANANKTTLPVIAVLEDYAEAISVETSANNFITRTTYEPRLRGVFVKHDNTWKIMCAVESFGKVSDCANEDVSHFSTLYAFSNETRYEIKVTGRYKDDTCCQAVGWLESANFSHHVTGVDRLLKYAGWPRVPVYKPKPVTNQKLKTADPEFWRTMKRYKKFSSKSWRKIASTVEDMKACTIGNNDSRRVVQVPWKKSYLELGHQHINQDGGSLIQAHLSLAYFQDCKRLGGTNYVPLTLPEFWLALSTSGEINTHFFKSWVGFSKLELIQFGDFDGDGKTEGLFFLSGYNEDGYVLLYDNMTKQVKFAWGYH